MATRKKTTEPTTAPAPEPKAGAVRLQFQIPTAEATKAQTARKSLFFNLEDGLNIVRVLPKFNGEKSLFTESMLHYLLKKPDDDGNYAPGCLHYYTGEKCYICEFVEWVQAHNIPLYADEMDNLRAQSNLHAQVFVQNRGTKEWEGPFLMKVPKRVAATMQSWLSMAQDTGTPVFVHPQLGMPVAINKSGKGKATQYDATLIQRPESLDALLPDWESRVIVDVNTKVDVKVVDRDTQKKSLWKTFSDMPWAEIQTDLG